MKTAAKRQARQALRPEPLEPRALRASGVSATTQVVQDLGLISRVAAIRGVEAVASIDAGHSVVFQFSAGAAGQYALRVRHDGEGLTIEARGPSGSATIDPGPPGPFQTLIVPFLEARYQIEATAAGDEPVFVDWELLLISGAGRAPAVTPTILWPAIPFPAPGPSTSGVAPTAPTPAPAPTSAIFLAVAPVGRPVAEPPIAVVGPTTPGGSMAMAFHGEGLPEGLATGDSTPRPVKAPVAASPLASTMAPDDLEVAALDEAFLTLEPWWGRLALAFAPEATPAGADAADVVEAVAPEVQGPEDGPTEPAGLQSSLTAGLVVSILVARRRILRPGPRNDRTSSPWRISGIGANRRLVFGAGE